MGLTFIPFDGWQPEQGYMGEGWATAQNLFPFFGSSRPWPNFVASANSLAPGEVAGRHVHLWMSGANTSNYSPDTATLFSGSLTQLYTVNPATGAWTNVSGVPTYAFSPTAAWRFASVGNDIWATNWSYTLQRRTNNTGNFANGPVSTFSPLPRFLAPIREHLVVANLTNGGRFQDEIAWSDADDATNFDPPTGTSQSVAGSKRLVSIPGQITGLVGGQYGLAFKRRAIYYLETTGTTQIFRPDVLSSTVGAALPSSIIDSRYGVFFLGLDGFYQIAGLSNPQKISPPEIDRFLLASAFSTQPATMAPVLEDLQAWGFQAPGFPLVGWLIHRDWNSPTSDEALLYNPVAQQWASVTFATPNPAVMFELPYAASLYEALAAVLYDAPGGVSTSTYAPLSAAGSVRAPSLQLRFRPANFETSRHQQQTLLKGVLPIFSKTSVSGTALTHSVTVESLLDPLNNVWTTEGPRLASQRDTISGMFPFQIAGRFFRISITCAAEDFASFDGVYVDQELLV